MRTRREFLRDTAAGIAAAGLPAVLNTRQVAAQRVGYIDLHAHWIGPRVVDLLKSRGTPASQGPTWFDIDARLQHLDQAGVQRQVVSWIGAAYDGTLTPEEARPLWRAQNDDVGALVKKHPTRFSGLASLPTANIAWAAEELDRAHSELGLIGATIPLDAIVSLEGARALAPIFAVAQKHRSHIFVHRGAAARDIPGQHPEVGATNAYFGLRSTSAPNQPAARVPGDDTVARAVLITSAHLATGVITLALTDFLDPYPDVTVQMAMIGGSIAFVAEQMELSNPGTAKKLRRVYVDTGSTGRGPRGIALAAKVFGADRILLGTDFGPAASVAPYIESVNASDLTPEEKNLILVGNGKALLAARGIA